MQNSRQAYRVIIIGDTSVGKTCIINKFIRGTFDPEETSTIGAFYDSYSEVYENQVVEIQLWDTAGQEQYRALGPMYYRGAAGAILVFDLTNRKTFEDLDSWLQPFRSECGDESVLVVVGNKSDLPNRDVLVPEAKKWAEDHGCAYIEASAKNGQGITNIFSELISALVVSNQNQTEHAACHEKLNDNERTVKCC